MPSSYRTSAVLEAFSPDAPYADRQKIVVVPDEVAAAERSAHKQLESADKALKIDAVIKSALEIVGSPRAFLVDTIVKAVLELRQKGLEIWTVGRDEVSSLTWAPGHPLDNVVYVGNPAVADLYYPAAEFHRRVFEHKFCEAIELVMALGASSLHVQHVQGYDRADAAQLDVPLASTESIGAKLKKVARRDSDALFTATFPGSTTPFVPDNLVWLASERSWQTLVEAREKHRAGEFGLNLHYQSDFGIDAKLKAAIDGVGLSLGGKFHEHKDTLWRVSATFPVEQTMVPALSASGVEEDAE
jgi:hypothetical protein